MRHLLSIDDLTPGGIAWILDHAQQLMETSCDQQLRGRFIGLWFELTSTRTRTSFHVAAHKLGASVVPYGGQDLQICTGESLRDTGTILSQFLDVLVIRTPRMSDELHDLTQQESMSLISAMTQDEHPVQALTDLVTIKHKFGSLSNLHILYMGEGNSTAASLALAIASLPQLHLTLLTPQTYGLTENIQQKLSRRPYAHTVKEFHSPIDMPEMFDIVYTTRWSTTGTTKNEPDWKNKFLPFRVTQDIINKSNSSNSPIFMHDLPAHRGEEVDADVLDGRHSIAFMQARLKLFTAMAIIKWCFLGYANKNNT